MTNEEIYLYKKAQNGGENGSEVQPVLAETFIVEPKITVTITEVTE